MPLIDHAERVAILTVAETDSPDESAARLQRALRWHNPNVEVRTLRPDARGAVPTLLDAVTDAKACLLAMGGYGHARLREAVFGGLQAQGALVAPFKGLVEAQNLIQGPIPVAAPLPGLDTGIGPWIRF